MNVKKSAILSNKQNQHALPTGVGLSSPWVLEEKDYGTETEGEKQMKLILENQLKVDITLKEHELRHRKFTKSSTFTPMTELIQGACTLEKYKEVEKREEHQMSLQQSGLSKDEIRLYMMQKSPMLYNKSKALTIEPSALERRLQDVHDKIASHQNELQISNSVSGVKTLSRHAMDIERTLYAGCKGKRHLDHLVSQAESEILDERDPFKHIKDLSEKLTRNIHRKRKKRKTDNLTNDDAQPMSDEDNGNFVYDPSIHHVIVPLEDAEISAKRLTIEEIRTMPRFENYTPGDPNKVLYLKNLHPKTNLHELQAVFGRFQGSNTNCINYNLLSGRMRGQAFLTFPDVQTAKEALAYANGVTLRERPIIIEYGKKR